MQIDEELDRLYSPSKWSPRLNPSEIIEAHGNHLKNFSELARSKIPTLRVSYADEFETKIEFYDASIDNKSTIPFSDYNFNGKTVFVYLHGGYWQWGSYEWSGFMAESLCKQSFVVASLGYTIAPNCSMTNMVELVELGFVKILKKAIESKSKIIICGHSAGAHLVTSLMFVDYLKKYNLNDSCIYGLVLVSGVYDLTPLLKTEVNINLKMDKIEAEKLSYIKRHHFEITNDCLKKIKVLIVYGEFDPPSFKQQSIDFAQNLKLNVKIDNVTCYEIKDTDHFNVIENLSEESYELTRVRFKD